MLLSRCTMVMISMASGKDGLSCPACGKSIYRTDQHCLSCGVRLDGGELVGKASGGAKDRAAAGGEASSGGADAPAREAEFEVSYDTGAAPWRPERLPTGGGFFDSLARGWAFLKEALKMAFRSRSILVPSIAAVLTNVVVIACLGAILHHTGDLGAAGAEDEEISTAGYVILVAAMLVVYLNTYFFTGMTVHLVDRSLRRERVNLGDAFARSVENFGGIFALAMVTLVVGLIAGALRGKRRGGMGGIAADVLQRGWITITYLLMPIMILENVGFLKSGGRAKKLHAHNVIQIVVGELGLLIAAYIVGSIMVTIGVIGAVGLYFYEPALLPLAIGVVLLLFVFANAFIAYVRTSFYTCLYLWAVAMETVGEEAPAPAPLRPAIQAA